MTDGRKRLFSYRPEVPVAICPHDAGGLTGRKDGFSIKRNWKKEMSALGPAMHMGPSGSCTCQVRLRSNQSTQRFSHTNDAIVCMQAFIYLLAFL
jgi:hypothetical protein